MYYHGRKRIYAKTDDITHANVWDDLSNALSIHKQNAADIDYLYNYYKGDQPIYQREKFIRPEINNKICINRAHEIVSFKRGYLLTEAIQYVRRDRENDLSEDVKKLNMFMQQEGKVTKDSVLAEWMYICGTGYRIALPKRDVVSRRDTNRAPFEFYTLDPREVFVAHSREVGNKPVYACIRSKSVADDMMEDNTYTVYTSDKVFKIVDGAVSSVSDNPLGMIPVIEYPENYSRLGSFEIVLDILDAISLCESNQLDDIEQVVQSLLVLIGVDLSVKDADGNDKSTIETIRDEGGISIPEGSDIKYLSMPLNQGTTKQFVSDLEQAWLTICGMPNRNGGTSTSDTGSAVYLRDGHSEAELRAMNTQTMWEESEKEFLRVVLFIMNQVERVNYTENDIIPHFNRQNTVNLQSKTQSFCEMMSSNWISLDWALKMSGLPFDVESCYEDGMKWHEDQEQKRIQELQDTMKYEHDDSEDNSDEKS